MLHLKKFYKEIVQTTYKSQSDKGMLKHLLAGRICFNIHWFQALIQAFWQVGFAANYSAEKLLQQNSKIVEANKNS